MVLSLVLFVPACAGRSDTTGPATEAPAPGQVVINGFAFNPTQVTVKVGETVTWENHDPVVHTVSGEGLDSGDIATGASYSRTFDRAGALTYQCKYHPAMKGTLVVR
ncbi:MAG: cupredoxin domain-containing protein [Chloroflexi bacterium]|nr:cupredoxin domain-containing protein [Chloroflexota bacterium]